MTEEGTAEQGPALGGQGRLGQGQGPGRAGALAGKEVGGKQEGQEVPSALRAQCAPCHGAGAVSVCSAAFGHTQDGTETSTAEPPSPRIAGGGERRTRVSFREPVTFRTWPWTSPRRSGASWAPQRALYRDVMLENYPEPSLPG